MKCIAENMILHEIFRVDSRFSRNISYYIAESDFIWDSVLYIYCSGMKYSMYILYCIIAYGTARHWWALKVQCHEVYISQALPGTGELYRYSDMRYEYMY